MAKGSREAAASCPWAKPEETKKSPPMNSNKVMSGLRIRSSCLLSGFIREFRG
jgi:hypothetical protein